MNCKELAYLLADYFDGSMDPNLSAELDAHIAQCEPCMKFAKTYHVTCKTTAQLRHSIEYQIPDEVRARLASFLISAARKYPEQMEEYHRQAEQERTEKVRAFCRAATEAKLSAIASLLVETHCATCPECKEYFDTLQREKGKVANHPPRIQEHVTLLMESLPPGEEFFLA
jgi:predicted anti-sigma-YlaC factor YlaD